MGNRVNGRVGFGLRCLLAFLLVWPLIMDAFTVPQASALNNGLAQTPPMGWNSWNYYACNVDENKIKEAADLLVSTGMKDAGYKYVVIDDCWQTGRDANGTILADPVKFPSGMKALADYIHSKGLLFGLYTDAGYTTCAGRPGMYNHEVQDALTFASWDVDYVKVDWCDNGGMDPQTRYTLIRDALLNSGRDILFSICNWGINKPWIWGAATGNMWRTTDDIFDFWQRVTWIIDQNYPLANFAGPGRWNDPDMLMVGNYGTGAVFGEGMTDTEYRSHFSMWAIMAAPLIAGNNLSSMTAYTRATLMNSEVIAIDQDPLGRQGVLVSDVDGKQVYSKLLQTPGTRAVVLFNRSETAASMTVNFTSLGLGSSAAVRDLWQKSNLGTYSGSYSATVPAHGTVMLKLTGTEATTSPVVSGKTYRIIPKSTGLSAAVEASSTQNGAKVLQWDYGISQNDKWTVTATTGGFYKLMNVNSGKALAVENGDLQNNAKVLQWDYGTTGNDQWQIQGIGQGYYKIINKLSGKSLNVADNSLISGGGFIQWTYGAEDNMTFQLVETDVTYEAESAVLHSLSTESAHQGYTGKGYISGWNANGKWVDFNVIADTAGVYNLTFRYSGGAGTAGRYLYVNGAGVVSNVVFNGTGGWNSYNNVTIPNVTLNSGSNTISLIYDTSKGSTNYLNLDHLKVSR
ncbi:RICIN domain-containing protein [Paenibacillus graminis]|uniref:RICIN domain-containing protein n=2 Tax=Paenibacillus graminis TaxID=189425 RepID=UPI002DBD811F|nr:RICIN domain-containing protein [Paenibacillus graminis]MEC0167039.1 RICIN domain-containing protein [Paenibacillus graminis]